jgi:hypothetical protein
MLKMTKGKIQRDVLRNLLTINLRHITRATEAARKKRKSKRKELRNFSKTERRNYEKETSFIFGSSYGYVLTAHERIWSAPGNNARPKKHT